MRRLLLGLAALLLATTSCEVKFNWAWNQPGNAKDAGPAHPSGKVVTEDRKVAAFDRIHLDGLGQLIFDASVPAGVVRVKADQAVLGQIRTSVEGTTLTLNEEGFSGPGSWQLEYRTAAPANLREVTLNGLGSVTALEALPKVDTLELNLNGLGQIDLGVAARQVTLHQKGSGELAVHGSAETVQVIAEGMGRVGAEGLKARTADVDSRGMGEVNVFADQAVKVRASGMGAVHFSGHPGQKDVETEGMTSVSASD